VDSLDSKSIAGGSIGMNIDSIRRYCLSFPLAKENLQWGETLCFKVAGKIFVTLSLGSVPPSLCLKCTPEKFAELCEQEGIRPAPYVGRYKWVLLERSDILADDELEGLIRDSYEMVSTNSKGKAKLKLKMAKMKVSGSNHKEHEGSQRNKGNTSGTDC
jgi:predicted DNA-binding protein (MmcQ/YjbR family)